MKYVLKFLKISIPIYGQYLRAGYNGSSTVFFYSILHFLFLVNCLEHLFASNTDWSLHWINDSYSKRYDNVGDKFARLTFWRELINIFILPFLKMQQSGHEDSL